MPVSDFNYHGPVVAFDLDDTLFRERDFCRSGFRFLCNPEKYLVEGIETYPSGDKLNQLVSEMDEALCKRENPFVPFEEFFTSLMSGETKESFDIKKHIEAYRNHKPENLDFAEGAEQVLKNLSDRGVAIALITDGRSGTQRRKIEALGLNRYIAPELIFISEETGFDKYSRQSFAQVVRKLPESRGFYYIGDNPLKDFNQANLMGWTTFQVPYHPDNVHPQCEPPSPLHSPQKQLYHFTDLLLQTF